MRIRTFFLCFYVCGVLQVAAQQSPGKVTVLKDPLIDSLIARRLALHTQKATATQPSGPVSGTLMGYRVQIFYGLDRRETFSVQQKFKGLYPRVNTYITYREPNYYLRAGDFRTRSEAQQFLEELRSQFPTLFIFREKINAPVLEENP